jgi:hypothetical protein
MKSTGRAVEGKPGRSMRNNTSTPFWGFGPDGCGEHQTIIAQLFYFGRIKIIRNIDEIDLT